LFTEGQSFKHSLTTTDCTKEFSVSKRSSQVQGQEATATPAPIAIPPKHFRYNTSLSLEYISHHGLLRQVKTKYSYNHKVTKVSPPTTTTPRPHPLPHNPGAVASASTLPGQNITTLYIISSVSSRRSRRRRRKTHDQRGAQKGTQDIQDHTCSRLSAS